MLGFRSALNVLGEIRLPILGSTFPLPQLYCGPLILPSRHLKTSLLQNLGKVADGRFYHAQRSMDLMNCSTASRRNLTDFPNLIEGIDRRRIPLLCCAPRPRTCSAKHGVPGPGSNARKGTDPSGITPSRGEAVWKLHLSLVNTHHLLTSEAAGPSIFRGPLDNVLGASDRLQCICKRRDLRMPGPI